MSSAHVKKGDTVKVISGSYTGVEGKILQMLPKKDRAIVEGVAMRKRHTKKSQENPQGAIVEREGSIHISNLKPIVKKESSEKEKSAD
ncbi:MAG: 50S ribosomal protein L24 [Opitutales bacterium]